MAPFDWAAAQKKDPTICRVRAWYERGGVPEEEDLGAESYEVRAWAAQLPRLTMVEGVLGRWWMGPAGRGAFQIAVPMEEREEVMHQVHGAPLSGHLGRARTLRRAQQGYYWPQFRQDITAWCARCEPCIRRKSAGPPHRAAMGHVAAGLPMQRVAMDIMGPLPESADGNRHILVVADYFTKWTEAFPMKNQEAATVARIFRGGICVPPRPTGGGPHRPGPEFPVPPVPGGDDALGNKADPHM